MNFQQLRIIRETIRRDFNLTEVGNALYTSQSGVSKHIKDLEEELGVELFVRKGKRLITLTEPGKELAGIVDRMLLDVNNIKHLAEQFNNCNHGQLTIATTHSQARYALPHVVTQFKQAYPDVHLVLHQGSPEEIIKMIVEGKADLGIATEALSNVSGLATFPYYSWSHAVIVPKGHSLANKADVTLDDLAQYPIITYHEGFTGRNSIDKVFETAGVKPNIVISALDADVIKTYVELGLGIGIVASIAYEPERDHKLSLLGENLFESNTTRIAVLQGRFLRGYVYRFIQLCSSLLDEITIRNHVSHQQDFHQAA